MRRHEYEFQRILWNAAGPRADRARAEREDLRRYDRPVGIDLFRRDPCGGSDQLDLLGGEMICFFWSLPKKRGAETEKSGSAPKDNTVQQYTL